LGVGGKLWPSSQASAIALSQGPQQEVNVLGRQDGKLFWSLCHLDMEFVLLRLIGNDAGPRHFSSGTSKQGISNVRLEARARDLASVLEVMTNSTIVALVCNDRTRLVITDVAAGRLDLPVQVTTLVADVGGLEMRLAEVAFAGVGAGVCGVILL
jgi:hypothetical protein